MCNERKQAPSWNIFLTEAERLLRDEKDRERRKELKLAVKELKWLIRQKVPMPTARKKAA
jgi:hypothetical protein